MPYKDPIKQKEYFKKYRETHHERIAKYQQEYQLKFKDTIKDYKHWSYKRKRFKKYNITESDFFTQVELQENKCKICSIEFKETRPCVDHCHTTGQFRGVLCINCNTALGSFKDNITILKKAIKYLEASCGTS